MSPVRLAIAGLLLLSATASARPPQNPYMAPNPNSNIHNDTWMTDVYSRPGPRGTNLQTQLGPYPPSLCGSVAFDSAGRIVSVCPSSVSPPVARIIDPKTLAVLGQYEMPTAADPPGTKTYQNFTGGGYFFLDNQDRIVAATKTSHLFVLAEKADATGFDKVGDYDLTGVLSPDERVTSALPDFQGRIWFVSKKDGVVGILNEKTGKVLASKMNEEIENSFAVDRDGVYIVSDKRMYRFSVGGDGRPAPVWSVKYRNSGIVKPSQVDAGSGTTPTIMDGGFVAITDNADPMDVVVYRTAKKLKKGFKRVVCQVPVFAKGASATENSLLGTGRTLIVENNYGYQDPFGPTAGAPSKAGFARVDIDKNGKGCRKVWTNTTDSSPTVVPKLSTKTGLIYAYDYQPDASGQSAWQWTAISAKTGRNVWRKTASTDLLTGNNNYAGLALGPDGTAYLGTIGGMEALRDG